METIAYDVRRLGDEYPVAFRRCWEITEMQPDPDVVQKIGEPKGMMIRRYRAEDPTTRVPGSMLGSGVGLRIDVYLYSDTRAYCIWGGGPRWVNASTIEDVLRDLDGELPS